VAALPSRSSTIVTVSRMRRLVGVSTIWSGGPGDGHGDISPSAPFGGCKASGVGRECGRPGLDAYAELQTRVVHKA
jgi:acyl-CoA reductase-like NAD-dependent aldehyde dehydrogenase